MACRGGAFVAFSLGVDIGTTYTAAGLWRDGTVNSVPLGNRSHAVPSVLFLRDDGVLLVGEAASRRAVTEPSREARDFKRRMGDEVPIRMGDKSFRANELTGHLRRWVIYTASEREGGRPDHVVLTCAAAPSTPAWSARRGPGSRSWLTRAATTRWAPLTSITPCSGTSAQRPASTSPGLTPTTPWPQAPSRSCSRRSSTRKRRYRPTSKRSFRSCCPA